MPAIAPSVITIGTFDGVHLGHRAIVARARTLAQAHGAREHGARVVVFAFDPHPSRVLRPESEPPRLITREQKLQRLREAGADEVVVLEPTRELLGQSPERFIETLAGEHRPRAVVEGPDFRFGQGRKGDIALLRQFGERFGFEVHVQEPVEVMLSNQFALTVSSSAVRWLVGHGRVVDAAICLDQPHVLTAPVIRGEQRGRTIGVPTVNLDPEALREYLVPPDGVYAGTVQIHGEPEAPYHAAALSVGTKPTFEGARFAVEAHLLDFDDDIYGRTVSVRFARWLREQVRFPDLESLIAQLQRDIAQTRWCQRCDLLDPPRRPLRVMLPAAGPGGAG